MRATELRQEGDELLIAHTLRADRLTSLGKARKLSDRQSRATRGLRDKILRIRGDVADVVLLQLLLSGGEILTTSLSLREDTSIDIIGILHRRVRRRVEVVAHAEVIDIADRHSTRHSTDDDVGRRASQITHRSLERIVAQAVDRERLVEEPHSRSLLLSLRHDLVAREARGFTRLIEVDPRDVEEDIGDIAHSLIGDPFVEGSTVLCFVIVGEPLV